MVMQGAARWLHKQVGIKSKRDKQYLVQRILEVVPENCVVPIRSETMASERTFRRAFKGFKAKVRLLNSKGSFSTCHVCTVAAELLRSREKRFTKLNRDIVLKWRRLHLEQQAQEREHLEIVRVEATKMVKGQPVLALIYPG
jgi:hypothetical protein